ncbi:phosphate/phosphite/phosphonate ABC transporter substrate-binding protein [Segnochrobactrum spirostomi]|uniref:Phosphate/phosphite/phosphonate ABC transporter substrate-binding protein n=1 Tax=Segnochrobactrum spirostomi TaxID=2608987 RepID=A0A6A7Y240_9HYPH|nr:PhnD/SsuA/transferrin family substrate-binding protein [Segnochrobactrum spirostomi]MQT12428.1 phosphate/phosphite/phosphonate ABC transporter substrate-binding protein [Segnochrobactrum spirostomi]
MGYKFLIDTNLPIDTKDREVATVLRDFDISVEGSTDLPSIGRKIAAHEPDLAFIPSADYHRFLQRGDWHYRGLVIPTSKFTGLTDMPSVLVVRQDDPATGLIDLKGTTYGYINKSCTSSYFPPAVMLTAKGIPFAGFLDMRPVRAWQGQIDAVINGEVRSTMVPEDVWRTNPANAATTKIIDRYDHGKPAIVVARHDLDPVLRAALTEALVRWVPPWSSIYGCFKPFLYADVHYFFHELNELPAGT